MKQTAVEWLYNEIKHIIPNDYVRKFEQAKEIEKQQIIDAYYYDPNCDAIKDDGEQYYNETFK